MTVDDRPRHKLPITGEVGSEGGSYAEPTLQRSWFEGDVGQEAEAAEPQTVESDRDDVLKYPKE